MFGCFSLVNHQRKTASETQRAPTSVSIFSFSTLLLLIFSLAVLYLFRAIQWHKYQIEVKDLIITKMGWFYDLSRAAQLSTDNQVTKICSRENEIFKFWTGQIENYLSLSFLNRGKILEPIITKVRYNTAGSLIVQVITRYHSDRLAAAPPPARSTSTAPKRPGGYFTSEQSPAAYHIRKALIILFTNW